MSLQTRCQESGQACRAKALPVLWSSQQGPLRLLQLGSEHDTADGLRLGCRILAHDGGSSGSYWPAGDLCQV